MAVRIVADYWQNYKEYKDVIRRCFLHILHKFCIDDSIEAVYNTVLVELHRQQIFLRFDPSKTETSTQSVDKRLEQYLYMWINQILSNMYKKRGVQMGMFVEVEDMEEYYPGKYCDNPLPVLFSEEEEAAKDGPSTFEKKYPWHGQTLGFFVGEQENAEDKVFFNEIVELVRAKIPERNRLIFDLIVKDYDPQSIAKLLGCSSEMVYRAVRESNVCAQKLMSK